MLEDENLEAYQLNDIKLIVTDLDDTLLRRDKTISDYTVDVFRRIHKRDVLIAFATARSYESSQRFRDWLKPDGDIVTGGCLVFSGDQLLQSYYLPEPQGSKLLAELEAHKPNKRVSARSMHRRYANISVDGRICVSFKNPLPDRLIHCSCRTDDDDFMQEVATRYPEFSFLRSGESDLYDINPIEATKLNGIKTIARLFDIPLSEVIAFGDNYNDIEMLDGCGVGVAMDNAIDDCKSATQYVCGDCDDDGVARWLEENLL